MRASSSPSAPSIAARAARGVGEQERQVDEAELRHPVGEIARRLVAERQQAVLDQPQDVVGAIAEVHDVPDVLDLDPVAELGFEPVADQLQRAAEAGGGGAVAAHADLDRIAHLSGPCRARRLIGTATPETAMPSPMMTRMPATPVAAATSPASAGKHHLADAVAGHPQRQRRAVGLGRRDMHNARDGERRGDAHGESERDQNRIHGRQRQRKRQHQEGRGAAEHADQRERHAAEADRSSWHRTRATPATPPIARSA